MTRTTLRHAPLWLLLAAAALLTMNLDRYPAPWFDEGLNIGAAASLASRGLYALPEFGGPIVMDVRIQTGPTVIVPIAALFRVLGHELLYARLVIAVFGLLAVLLYWRVATRVFGERTALAASLCLLAGSSEPFSSFVYLGRQVIGEVPALALVLAGQFAALRSWSHPRGTRRRLAWAAAAGIAWGAAMVTKSQVFVILPAALACVCAADLLYFRRRVWPSLALSAGLALSCVGGWYALQYVQAGDLQFRENVRLAHEGFRLHIADLNLAHMRNAAGVLWRSGFLLWGMPGLLWGLYTARTRDDGGLQRAFLLALPLVALGWYILLSIGWARYVFYTFALLPIWTADALVAWLGPRLRVRWWGLTDLAAGMLLAIPLAASGANWWTPLALPPPNGFESMRQYLRTGVPAGALIETWEWELSLDGSLQIRHPSTERMYQAINAQFSRRPRLGVEYAGGPQPPPDYLVTGPFGDWTGIYRQLIAERGTALASFPPYAIYRIRHGDD